MMKIYQVDAFVSERFRGNTAGVCLLKNALNEAQMQAIAAEMGYAETAFVVPEGDHRWNIRWFTPAVEVALCGHATLTAAWVLAEIEGVEGELTFSSLSGDLSVAVEGEFLTLNFPAYSAASRTLPDDILKALALESDAQGYYSEANGGYWIAEVSTVGEVQALEPNMAALREALPGGLIVTALGENCDFVSRFFAPALGIDEDDVTGSAHCALTPLWSERLGKTELLAHQLSDRGGEIHCTLSGDRVLLKGQARLRTVRQLSGSFFTNDFA
ncbi:PhzF family phenazine biosynthesis protein [Litorivivens lipolytica]|uniref:PhzF family phenazine biosynthesis protein n=1 Tax=Litorivivens lipolytica TaxID=1524264 RepID=A0A7W4Z5C3_9GAMM|nr:PhzF family phenazine biosynthesis protein [Litorivivens lipolytica]MBB3047344.1 PhzF family phenazine biosynthesis protein [Litorivivens lipolytica]